MPTAFRLALLALVLIGVATFAAGLADLAGRRPRPARPAAPSDCCPAGCLCPCCKAGRSPCAVGCCR